MMICGRIYAAGLSTPVLICHLERDHAGDHETGQGARWPDSSCDPAAGLIPAEYLSYIERPMLRRFAELETEIRQLRSEVLALQNARPAAATPE